MRVVPTPARRSEPPRSVAPVRRAAARQPDVATPAGALDLQRLVGNARTTQVIARALPTRMLQRLASADDLQQFAVDYHKLLEKIREKPAKITKFKKELAALKTRAQTAGLDASHARMYSVLQDLSAGAEGTLSASEVATLAARDPAAIGHVGSIAAATFIPTTDREGTGTYTDADMRALLDHEKQRHPKAKEEPVLRMNIAITAVEQAYRRHQQALTSVTTTGETLMVFLGAEWFFGMGRPYSMDEYNETVKRIVAVSALYPDVIFIPGTILTYDKKKGDTYRGVRNFCPVAWHGRLITTVQKQLHGGDLAKEHFIGGEDEDPTFSLGDLKLALDICQDHFNSRARGWGTDADVHIVTSAGSNPDVRKTAVKPLGFMLGADVGGAGPAFKQVDPQAERPMEGHSIGADTLAYGDPHAKQAGKQGRLIDYMAPQAVGVQVPTGSRVTYKESGPYLPKPTQLRKVQIVDSQGNLREITV